MTLDDVLHHLQAGRQRATYGAVASFLGSGAPISLMRGRDKCPPDSWIVSKKHGKPTGYEDKDMHQSLFEKNAVISDGSALAAWIAERLDATRTAARG